MPTSSSIIPYLEDYNAKNKANLVWIVKVHTQPMGMYSKKVDKLDKPIEVVKERAEALYRKGDYLCSQAVFTVVNDYLGRPVPPEAVRMASEFPVGMGTAGCACGALSGGVMKNQKRWLPRCWRN